MIEKHRAKIEQERAKPHPNEAWIGHWRLEIELWQRQIARLNRRLRREW